MKWRLAIADGLRCRPSDLDAMTVAEFNMLIAWEVEKAEQRRNV